VRYEMEMYEMEMCEMEMCGMARGDIEDQAASGAAEQKGKEQ
jgi:hypothetical protein